MFSCVETVTSHYIEVLSPRSAILSNPQWSWSAKLHRFKAEGWFPEKSNHHAAQAKTESRPSALDRSQTIWVNWQDTLDGLACPRSHQTKELSYLTIPTSILGNDLMFENALWFYTVGYQPSGVLNYRARGCSSFWQYSVPWSNLLRKQARAVKEGKRDFGYPFV